MAIHHYKSKAAHLAVMAELAWREYNVAMPEIDIGDDIFAVKDSSGNMWRLQVKYSQAKKLKKGYSGTFGVRHDQLVKPTSPELYYVFVIKKECGNWFYLILPRQALETHFTSNKFGHVFFNKSLKKEVINFHVFFNDNGEVSYSTGSKKKFLTDYLNNWGKIPAI
ncbi:MULTISPECIES: hypothetical protein [Erwinia]|uniref:PD(D/E)XK endonuclease domain-containing protein n=2 Tax=Erwinia TaxID=551 RepID=A0A014PTG5_9GAMM|nr:hypothetical protein [Erwinia mallotivora]EXU74137.1 hypothetical protein BG55_19075 [Erwinia mallotivora]